MRAALDIALKDLRQRIRDRSLLLIAIVAPLTLATLFSVMLGDVEEDFQARWAIVDLDGREIAGALLDGPIAGLEEAGVINLRMLSSRVAAHDAVERGEVHTALVIPAGFSRSAGSGLGGEIELITDPDASISAQIARSVLRRFTSEVEAVGLSVATAISAAGRVPNGATTESLADLARSLPDPIVIVDDDAADRTASTSTYYAAAMAILFVFLGAQFGVTSLFTEKRQRTLARMVAAPIRPVSILAGKTMVSMIVAVGSMTVIIVGTSFLLGARWGDPIALASLIVAAALAATGLALLVVSFAKSEDQAGSAVAIIAITLAVLGGSFFPVAQGSGVLAQLSLLTPHHWFILGVSDVATGGDVVSAARSIAALAGIGLASGAVGLWRARQLVVS